MENIATHFRAANFCAGPASLPTAVLEKAQADMPNWQGKGVSVMEMSHRSPAFVEIAQQAEADLRTLMQIPENYKVLFLQGGASLQFSAIPLNLLGNVGRNNAAKNNSTKNNAAKNPQNTAKANFIDTGIWSAKAIKEAQRYGVANVIASTKESGYTHVPSQAALAQAALAVEADASYLHYCPNETINGVAFNYVPQIKNVPVVADMSSCILSEQIDVSQFGLIYAGAQKNIGPAGLTIVIVREDLLGHAHPLCPSILNYQNQAESGSMLNTPATYSWYLAGLVFEWLKEQGGVAAMQAQNAAKAKLLYGFIDSSDFYSNAVAVANRSKMNVPFTLADDALNAAFLAEAEESHLLNLKGHRSVGGMRASIYNAITLSQVQNLVDFMADFEKKHA